MNETCCNCISALNLTQLSPTVKSLMTGSRSGPEQKKRLSTSIFLPSVQLFVRSQRVSYCPSVHSTIQYGLPLDLSYVPCPFPSRLFRAQLFFKIGAIAAGNCIVLKPSELAPAISGLIAELVPKYMDSDVIRVVLGAVLETTKVCNSLSLCMDRVFSWVYSSWNTNGAMVRSMSYFNGIFLTRHYQFCTLGADEWARL